MGNILIVTEIQKGTIRESSYELVTLAQSLGGPGLFFVALADSSFLSVPEGNDLLIVVLSTGQTWDVMAYYVLMTVLGSIVGCSVLYYFGRKGGGFIERRAKKLKLERIEKQYQKWGLWAIIIPSILPPPTPFKAFVLSAGVFKVPFKRFLIAVSIGRSIRYFMWGILAVLYGEWTKHFIENNMGKVGLILLGVILMAALSFFVFRKSQRTASRQEAQ